MNELSIPELHSQLSRLDAIPSVPAILLPVLRYLAEPAESVDVQRVVELVAHDKSLAAQTLHMANSPLFGHSSHIDSVRAAVLALGVSRMREIAGTCCLLRLTPIQTAHVEPHVYWEHSLACALVARKLARRAGYQDPEKAYLAGLLHDLGFIVNMLLFPEQFWQVVQTAKREKAALGLVEQRLFGFDHTLSGELLAAKWSLSADLQEVIRRHHQPDSAQVDRVLVGIVAISDLLCRTSGLGYGYEESLHCDLKADASLQALVDDLPKFITLGWGGFLAELQAYAKEVRNLVSVLFRMN